MSTVRQLMKQTPWVFNVLSLMLAFLLSAQSVELKQTRQLESSNQLVLFEHDAQDLLDVSDDSEDPEFVSAPVTIVTSSKQYCVASQVRNGACSQDDSSHPIRAPPEHLV